MPQIQLQRNVLLPPSIFFELRLHHQKRLYGLPAVQNFTFSLPRALYAIRELNTPVAEMRVASQNAQA